MTIAPIRVPVTHLEPEVEAMPKRPKLAVLNKKNRVKLRLNLNAFVDACNVIGALTSGLGDGVMQDPWLAADSAESRAVLSLMLDLYETQMQQYALVCPEQVTLSLSRCEALMLWKWWMLMQLPGSEAPHFAAVMSELHQLLA